MYKNKQIIAKLSAGIETNQALVISNTLDNIKMLDQIQKQDLVLRKVVFDRASFTDYVNGQLRHLEKITFMFARHDELVLPLDLFMASPVRTLKICGLKFNLKKARTLVSFMQAMQLNKLWFDQCYFDENALRLIVDTIKESTLRCLCLDYVAIRDEKIMIVADCVTNSKLTKLSAHNIGFANVRPLMNSLVNVKSTIQILDWRHNNFYDTHLPFVDYLKHAELTKLYVDFYSYDRGTIQTMDAIRENACIKRAHIYINRSNLNTEGDLFDTLCDLVKYNSHLTHLTLRIYYLDKANLIKLIDALNDAPLTLSYLSLDLSANKIDCEIISIICTLLERHNLHKLNLNRVQLNDKLLQPMLTLIKGSMLIKFNFDYNRYSSCDVARGIKDLVRQNKLAYRSKRFATTKAAR